MDYSKIFETVVIAIAAFAAVGGGLGGLYYAFRSKQIKYLKDELDVVKDSYSQCEVRHAENEARILELEKKIDHTVNIPLQEISTHMKKTNQLLTKLVKENV